MTTNNCAIATRKILIIGASSGIGNYCVSKFDSLNYQMLLTGRNLSKLDKVENVAKSATKLNLDFSDLKQYGASLEELIDSNPDLTDLVFIAGIHDVHSIFDCDLDKFMVSINTNLTAAYIAIAKVSACMKKNNFGRIVVVSSISGTNGEAYAVGYSAAKSGLNGLVKAAALELAKYNILINAICPAWLNNQKAIEQLTDDKWCQLNNIEKTDSIDIARWSMPTQRLIDESEVADLIAFLIHSNQSITGQSLNICGGLSLVQ